MLKGINPLLNADLLWALAAMGHGDDVALVDANHPAERLARTTASGKLIRLTGTTMDDAARAILSVLPIDDFTPDPIRRMAVVGDPAAVPPVQADVNRAIVASGLTTTPEAIDRFAFYEAARDAFAIVQTSDSRPYGCYLFRKGVINAV